MLTANPEIGALNRTEKASKETGHWTGKSGAHAITNHQSPITLLAH
jgi:hypothetical protein